MLGNITYVHRKIYIGSIVACYWRINLEFFLIEFSKSVTSINDGVEILLCLVLVVIYLVIMFLNNHSGQLVINTSMDIFIEL